MTRPPAPGVRRRRVVGLALLGCLTSTAACTSTSPTADEPVTTSPTPMSTTTVPASTTVRPSSATSTTPRPAQHSATARRSRTSEPPRPVAECRSRGVRLTSATSHHVRRYYDENEGKDDLELAEIITVRNVSQSPCSLSGWAGVQYQGDGTQIACDGNPGPCGGPTDTKKFHTPRTTLDRSVPAPTVRLAAGRSTTFGLLHPGAMCLDKPYRVLIRLPDDSRPVTIRSTVCNSITVMPFGRVPADA